MRQPGKTAFEGVPEAIFGKTAGSWREQDLVWAFNFSASSTSTMNAERQLWNAALSDIITLSDFSLDSMN